MMVSWEIVLRKSENVSKYLNEPRFTFGRTYFWNINGEYIN